MIYICTVHFGSEQWISRQDRYLRRNLDRDYRVMACVPPQRRRKTFYLESAYEPESEISFNHADKLNYLAGIVVSEAKPDDIIVFMDGDAFPIQALGGYLEQKLGRYPLIAVQRLENDGDIQPHPSFAATTVRFWREIAGDWNPGFEWADRHGRQVTDTGGNLLQKLNLHGAAWYPMLRSNRRNLHPLWFGIYDDVIYHHGAGYRKPVSRLDLNQTGTSIADYEKTEEYRRFARQHQRIFRSMAINRRFFKMFV